MDAIALLRDLASRPLGAARALGEDLTPQVLSAHPGGHPNSVAWLLWHAAREMDAQVAALSGDEQVWSAQGFDRRFALGEIGDQIGVGQTEEQARAITVDDPELLLEHLAAVTAAVDTYLGMLTDDDLDDVVDDQWDPPVTRGVRLISLIDDAAQHIGQAAYVVGMPRRD